MKRRFQRLFCKFFQVDTHTQEHKTSLYLQSQNFTAHRMVPSDWAVVVTFRTYEVREFGRTSKKTRQNDHMVCVLI